MFYANIAISLLCKTCGKHMALFTYAYVISLPVRVRYLLHSGCQKNGLRSDRTFHLWLLASPYESCVVAVGCSPDLKAIDWWVDSTLMVSTQLRGLAQGPISHQIVNNISAEWKKTWQCCPATCCVHIISSEFRIGQFKNGTQEVMQYNFLLPIFLTDIYFL